MKSTDRIFVVLRGVPGSGKSEIANVLASMHGCVKVITTDDYWTRHGSFDKGLLLQSREWTFCQARRAFEEHTPLVILADSSIQEREFKRYVELAEVDGYHTYCLIVENRHGGNRQSRGFGRGHLWRVR